MIRKKHLVWASCILITLVIGSLAYSTVREYFRLIGEAHKNEYMERNAIWNTSKSLTAKDMLACMTTVAKGDSVLVCKVSRITLQEYADFMKECAQPTRRTWVSVREAYMESLINGVEWMETRSKTIPFSSSVLWSKSKVDEQGHSRKSFHNAETNREKELNKLYPRSLDSEIAFKVWAQKHKSLFRFTHHTGKWILSFNDSYYNDKSVSLRNHGIVFPF